MNRIKKCDCCGTAYCAIQWAFLRYLGTTTLPWGEVLEYRDCSCGTTLTIQLRQGD
jgi:hypothetical protein